jgi:hypothetical protein
MAESVESWNFLILSLDGFLLLVKGIDGSEVVDRPKFCTPKLPENTQSSSSCGIFEHVICSFKTQSIF